MKRKLIGSGALGLIGDGADTRGTDDTVAWCNVWSDRPDGWHFTDRDAPLTGFSLSRRAGRRLRAALAADPEIRVEAACTSRLYEGESQCVTAILPGQNPLAEIWLYAHGFEPGANDNCSGVSTLIEAAAMLQTAIHTGALPAPHCSIRILITEECLGTLAFATLYPALPIRTRAGLNLDMCAAVSPASPIRLLFGPLSLPHIGWPLAGMLGDEVRSRIPTYHVTPRMAVPTGDDILADPACGIPSAQLGMATSTNGYHSSDDVPGTCRPASLRASALHVAAWAWTLATLNAAKRRDLRPLAHAWLRRHLVDTAPNADARLVRRDAAARALREPASWLPREFDLRPISSQATQSGGPVLRRNVWGTCTFDTLENPPVECSRWTPWQAATLFWMDGRRDAASILRLARAETGAPSQPENFRRYLNTLVRAGLVTQTTEDRRRSRATRANP